MMDNKRTTLIHLIPHFLFVHGLGGIYAVVWWMIAIYSDQNTMLGFGATIIALLLTFIAVVLISAQTDCINSAHSHFAQIILLALSIITTSIMIYIWVYYCYDLYAIMIFITIIAYITNAFIDVFGG